jgi:hypothetical protein
LDEELLQKIIKNRQGKYSLLENLKFFGENNLLATSDVKNKLNINQMLANIELYVDTRVSIEFATDLFNCAESFVDLDYQEIFKRSFVCDCNYPDKTIIDICEQKGATATLFSKNVIDEILYKLTTVYDSSSWHILSYLIKNHAHIGIDFQKIFRAISKDETLTGYETWCLFIEYGLTLETEDDLKFAFSWRYYDIQWIDGLKNIMEFSIFNIANKTHRQYAIDFIYRNHCGVLNLIEGLQIIGIDYIEQLKRHCKDPSFEMEMGIDFLSDWENIETLTSVPFLYQTQREFELYLTVGAYKYADMMIKQGFKPCFGPKIGPYIFDCVIEFSKNSNIGLEFFGEHFIEEPENNGELLVSSCSDEDSSPLRNSEMTLIFRQNIIDKVDQHGKNLKDPDCGELEQYLNQIKNDLPTMDSALQTIFKSLWNTKGNYSKTHVDVCLNMIHSIHGEDKAKLSLINVMISSLENIIRSTPILKAIIPHNESHLIKIFKSYYEEKDINFLEDIVPQLIMTKNIRCDLHMVVLFVKFSGKYRTLCDLLSQSFEGKDFSDVIFTETPGTLLEFVLDSIVKTNEKYSDYCMSIKQASDIFSTYNGLGLITAPNYDKIFKAFIYTVNFPSEDIVSDFFESLQKIFPIDSVVVDTLKNKTLYELESLGWFQNQYFCSHLLDKLVC